MVEVLARWIVFLLYATFFVAPSIEVSKLGTDLAYKYGTNRCGWSYGIINGSFLHPFRLEMSDSEIIDKTQLTSDN